MQVSSAETRRGQPAVNLHRPTRTNEAAEGRRGEVDVRAAIQDAAAQVECKSIKIETGTSYLSFKSRIPGAFNTGLFHGFNLHRPTRRATATLV
jgi:hypothetical protein